MWDDLPVRHVWDDLPVRHVWDDLPCGMAAIVDNMIRTTRAAAALAAEEDARKAKEAAVLPIEIFVAGMTGDSKVVFDWLDRGGDINAGEEVTQATLLMAAAVTGAALLLEVLIAKGSNIDSRDVHGQTALIFAALYGHAAILRQLAAAGAVLHLVCHAGLTAEQHATRAGHWECVCELRALERAQARRSDLTLTLTLTPTLTLTLTLTLTRTRTR